MQSESQRPVCVLSVGRSGTSLATRALGLLGLELGAEETMLAANQWNPTGFWELQAVNDLNDEILAALGGSLWNPPAPPDGWEHAPEMEPFRNRAAKLLEESFGGRGRWGFKDTRTVHTLPLWRSVVGPMDYLLCVRNPVDVVASLAPQLPGYTTVELYALWIRATALALRYTAGERRLFVFYEEWFADSLRVARRLAAFLEGSPDSMSDEAAERICGFFDPSLRTRSSGSAALAAPDVPPEVGAMHFLLRALAQAEERGSEEAPALQAVAAGLDRRVELGSMLSAERARLDNERHVREDRLAAVERERDALIADREWLRGQVAAIQADHNRVAVWATTLQAECDRLSHSAEEAQRLRDALRVLESSRTWRATAPLRAAARRLRGG